MLRLTSVKYLLLKIFRCPSRCLESTYFGIERFGHLPIHEEKLLAARINGNNSLLHSSIYLKKLHFTSKKFAEGIELSLDGGYYLTKEVKIRDELWVKNMEKLEKNCSDTISRHKHLRSAGLAEVEELLADTKEKLSLALLRNIYLRFRVTLRSIIESHLTEKVPIVKEEKKGYNLMYNPFNLERDLDYSFFLKQLSKDIKSGDLVSFLNQKGILNVAEFYEICEFALKGDQTVFFKMHPFDAYFMEEEVSSQILFNRPFDKDCTMKAIENISLEAIQSDSRKLVHYLLKLSTQILSHQLL